MPTAERQHTQSESVQVWVPSQLADRLREGASRNGRSLSGYARFLLRRELEREGGPRGRN